MAYDYFTIQALACEMRSHLMDAVIEQAYARGNEIAVAIGANKAWFYGAGGREGGMCLRWDPWPRSWSAGDGPEKYLVRARIVDIAAERRERIIRLRLERRDRRGKASFGVLLCQLIPNRVQFLLLREESGEILGQWSGAGAKGPSSIGMVYGDPKSAGRLLPGADALELWLAHLAQAEGHLQTSVRRWLCGADAHVVNELLYRIEGRNERELGPAIWAVASEIYGAEPIAQAYVWDEGGKQKYSALEPRRLGKPSCLIKGVSEAIWSVRSAAIEKQKIERRDQRVRGRLLQAIKNSRRRLKAMRCELAEADMTEECEKKGNALLANISELSAGATEVELVDIFDPEGRSILKIKMDPNRSPNENAARYLKAVKKYRRRLRVVPPRLRALEGHCDKLAQWIEEVEQGTWQDNAALCEWLEDNVKNVNKTAKGGSNAHPRRYQTSSGWSVWAGRNNKENDILSHKMSAQNDIWFHAHGYPGSHVVLRRQGRKEEPDKQTLEEAAGLAAFWSKGKTAKKVSVVYTLVKYVSKPRGGAPGQAILKREKTIVVAPALIKEENDA